MATVLQLAETHINCSSTIVVLMCENILVSVLSELRTVYHQALLVLSRYCRSEILWVMSTSMYIYHILIAASFVVVFSFKVASNFVCITFICMFLLRRGM